MIYNGEDATYMAQYTFFEETHVDLGVHYTLDGNLAPLNLTRSINDDNFNGAHSSCNRDN